MTKNERHHLWGIFIWCFLWVFSLAHQYHGGGWVYDPHCSQPAGGNQNVLAFLLRELSLSPIFIQQWILTHTHILIYIPFLPVYHNTLWKQNKKGWELEKKEVRLFCQTISKSRMNFSVSDVNFLLKVTKIKLAIIHAPFLCFRKNIDR